MTLQRSLAKRNPRPQSPFQNYILKSKPSNLNCKPSNRPQQKDSAILQHLLSKIESQSDTESNTEDQTIESHALPHTLTSIEHIPDDFLNVLTQISSKKYLIRIHLVFSEDFKLDTIALFDTGADLNCIKKRRGSKKIFTKYL